MMVFSATRLAAAVVAPLLFYPSAFASDAVIVLTAAGEAYEGPPEFQFLADGKVIGGGQVNKAVDTSNGARLGTLEGSPQDQIQIFVFTVPNIEGVSALDIEFTNDAWAGEGKFGDRNLFVIGLSLYSVQADPTNIVLKSGAYFGPSSFKLLNKESATVTSTWAALLGGGILRLERPAAGWVETKPTEAASPQAAVQTSPEKAATTATQKPAKKIARPLRKKKPNLQSATAKRPSAAASKAKKVKPAAAPGGADRTKPTEAASPQAAVQTSPEKAATTATQKPAKKIARAVRKKKPNLQSATAKRPSAAASKAKKVKPAAAPGGADKVVARNPTVKATPAAVTAEAASAQSPEQGQVKPPTSRNFSIYLAFHRKLLAIQKKCQQLDERAREGVCPK